MEFFKKTPPGDPSFCKEDCVLSRKSRLWCLLVIAFIGLLVSAKLLSSQKDSDAGSAIASVSIPADTASLGQPSGLLSATSKTGIGSESRHDPLLREIRGRLKKGESLEVLLSRLEVPPAASNEIISSLRQCLDFRKLMPKDEISVRLDDQNLLQSCSYEVSPFEIYDVARLKDSFLANRRTIVLERNLERISGTVSESLFQGFSGLAEKPSLVYAFADIFSSKIDFNTETRSGDRFNVIVEKYFKDGVFIGYGKILFASYHLIEDDRTLNAYSFENDGRLGYFNEQGEELGTSFLRSPVPIGRITSRFTFHRKHPITGIVKPHLGVDLAAPVGTPIMAAADGKVIFAGVKGGFGKQIILQHGNGYRTHYGHLSRFAKGVKRGKTVSQKQIIGYVGSTGVSTGPHLDYRLQENGVFRNPFAVKFKPRSILSGAELQAFQDTRKQYDSYLVQIEGNHHLIEAKEITFDDTPPKILL